MPKRIIDVIKELNVGLDTIVEFLSYNGENVERNPNAKITDEQYELLVEEFDTDKNFKEKSDSCRHKMFVNKEIKNYPILRIKSKHNGNEKAYVGKFKTTKYQSKETSGNVVQQRNEVPKGHDIRNAYRKLSEKPEAWVPIRSLVEELKWKGSVEFLREINNSGLQFSGDYFRVHNILKYEIWDDIYFDPEINSFPDNMEKLRKLALDEKWSEKLLENYICYTYARIKDEKKIAVSDDRLYACWNTGLVDFRYLPIYCCMSRKAPDKRWLFRAFCISGEDFGKKMNKYISKMPERAMYFEGSDMLCQPTEANLSVDSDHIIREHPGRLDRSWLIQAIGEENVPNERDAEYDKKLSEFVSKKSNANILLETLLRQSIEDSIKRCQWNYKTAIPYYNPIHKQLGWFLPLCIRKIDKSEGVEKTRLEPFAALVVTKGPSGRFQGETIYKLDWAYRCARLVCRPDSDWLTPNVDDKMDD